MSKSIRESTRYTVSIPAEVKAGGESQSAHLVNLSLGGGLITGVENLPMNTRLEVSFTIPMQSPSVSVAIKGTVRWANDKMVGVQFSNLRAREVWSLNKFFKLLSADRENLEDEKADLHREYQAEENSASALQ